MADDTRDPSNPPGDPGGGTPPEGLRVVPVDLETALTAIMRGRPMPEVLNATFHLLGSVMLRVREIEAESRIEGKKWNGDPYDPKQWEGAKQEILGLLDQARRIVTVEDYQKAAEGYDLAAMKVSSGVQ